MAHLLGSRNCLESLAIDIVDVHETITDIFGRVGPVKFPSWKYPDKASCDLDINKLLARYCFSKDEDHSKLSHIILFELLIDRLVLLMQAMSSFCNHLLSATETNRPGTAKSVGSAMSVGLVAKKFWNKMAHLYHVVQRKLTESDSKDKQLRKLEITVADMKHELHGFVKKSSSHTSQVRNELKDYSKISSQTDDTSLESSSQDDDFSLVAHVGDVDLNGKCKDGQTQTYDTAFVPCEACSRTQENLIAVGQMVMKVCKSQGLPSNLAKQKRLLKQSLLAAADISRWAAEQNRDLSRINDHLDNLYAQIDPLQEKLNKSRERRKALEEQVKSLEESVESERAESQRISTELSEKLTVLTQEMKSLQNRTDKEILDLKKGKELLEIRIEKSELELKDSVASKSKLESQCEHLKAGLEKERSETIKLQKMNEDLEMTKQTLVDLKSRLEKTTLELGKMQAKNKTLSQHDQVLQSKQDALLQRIDELDQDCEELREKVMDIEGERDELRDILDETKIQSGKLQEELTEKQGQIDHINAERNDLSTTIEGLQTDVQRLRHELELNEEKIQMMVQYPGDGLNSEVLDNPLAISREMEKQIALNNIRIAMLEEQNKKLRHSIEKLSNVQEEVKPFREVEEPVLLWSANEGSGHNRKNKTSIPNRSTLARSQSDSESRGHRTASTNESFRQTSDNYRQPRPPSSAKLEKQESRDRVFEQRQARALSSKLAHSGRNAARFDAWTPNTNTNTTARDDVSTTNYEQVDTFICGGCDKMYTTRKDLDIHKSFCYDLKK
ncbi:coiled-coil domain-containing protein 157-like [Dendronephthya gigantea]|uniref:coiled-coil domain-containing protein 157-like n=1 Tax=Dendronephthya gigantea TaxID=151771 RepID=UPI00106B7459|nr:coiled-coil domain-containing protein 157-like [Dendronephthya gigantea]